MVQNAKIQLLQPAEPIGGGSTTRHGHFPGGWSLDLSAPSSADEFEEKGGLANMAALGSTLPIRNRSRTHGAESPGSYGSSPSERGSIIKLNTADVPRDASYAPPTPSYAISASAPIPVGFVAHARDACISVPLTWDSEQPPQLWGDGGEYGEEWGRMHRRFRSGLIKMVQWYEEQGSGTGPVNEDLQHQDDEDGVDTVLILVTHGAGCNALIGALTNQPVLLDVGMASLTLAMRKENTQKTTSQDAGSAATSPTGRRSGKKSIFDTGLASAYEMKFTASVEHLRGNVNNPLASPRIGPAIGPNAYHYSSHNNRRTNTISSSSDTPFSIGESVSPSSSLPSRPMTSAGAASPPHTNFMSMAGPGTMHRSTSTHSPLRGLHHRPVSSTPMVSSGLWRSGTGTSVGSGNEGESGTESDTLPNFGASGVKKSPTGSRKKTFPAVGDVEQATKYPDKSSRRPAAISSAAPVSQHVLDTEMKITSAAEMDKQSLDPTLAQPNLVGPNSPTSPNINTNTNTTAANPTETPSQQNLPSKPIRTLSQKGLWGSAASLAFTEKDRDGISAGGQAGTANGTPKRRWTSVEQKAG